MRRTAPFGLADETAAMLAEVDRRINQLRREIGRGSGRQAAAAVYGVGGVTPSAPTVEHALNDPLVHSDPFTAGSVMFSDGNKLTEDNANLFWDDTNNRLGIGTATPVSKVDVYESKQVSTTATSYYSNSFQLDINVLANQTDKSMANLAYGTTSLGTHDYYWTRGITGVNVHSGTGIVNEAIGIASNIQIVNDGGSITIATVAYLGPPEVQSGTSDKTIGRAQGLFIATQKQSFVTTGYGIYQSGVADVNYFGGSCGIGVVAPAAQLEILKITEQLRLSYDAANYVQFVVGATGDIVVTPSGGDLTLAANLTMGDAKNIILNATTGSKIGTAITQKLGFWNAAPVIQDTGWAPTNVTTDRVFNANATSIDELADVLGTLLTALRTYGILGG